MKRIITVSILLVLTMGQFGCNSKLRFVKQKPLVVYLVRHAEKMDSSNDPPLTDAGKERALELEEVLRSANIEYVHSSNYIRTRETAKPTAENFGLTTEIYDPKDLEALADELRKKGGRHLVVGHSNTTPKMVNLLGGKAFSDINEASEYDRLYIVNISDKNNTSTILMRYGDPYVEQIDQL